MPTPWHTTTIPTAAERRRRRMAASVSRCCGARLEARGGRAVCTECERFVAARDWIEPTPVTRQPVAVLGRAQQARGLAALYGESDD